MEILITLVVCVASMMQGHAIAFMAKVALWLYHETLIPSTSGLEQRYIEPVLKDINLIKLLDEFKIWFVYKLFLYKKRNVRQYDLVWV